mmetsp:Transcript_17132/g.30746  ORF Transcript_17132/g.30746 Transcript_17132/m.30746 type:complete len:94 (+) Transcript_17132:910-1191(+)
MPKREVCTVLRAENFDVCAALVGMQEHFTLNTGNRKADCSSISSTRETTFESLCLKLSTNHQSKKIANRLLESLSGSLRQSLSLEVIMSRPLR